MLMNGKEVEHIVIGGEVFDRDYYVRKIRFLKEFSSSDGWVSPTEVKMHSGQGGVRIHPGDEGFTILKYKNGYCAFINLNILSQGFWVPEDYIEFID